MLWAPAGGEEGWHVRCRVSRGTSRSVHTSRPRRDAGRRAAVRADRRSVGRVVVSYGATPARRRGAWHPARPGGGVWTGGGGLDRGPVRPRHGAGPRRRRVAAVGG